MQLLTSDIPGVNRPLYCGLEESQNLRRDSLTGSNRYVGETVMKDGRTPGGASCPILGDPRSSLTHVFLHPREYPMCGAIGVHATGSKAPPMMIPQRARTCAFQGLLSVINYFECEMIGAVG